MTLLAIFCAAFLITHFGISSTPLRATLVNSMGDGAFLGVYSLISFITLGGMIYAYIGIPHLDFIWMPTTTLYVIAKLLLLLSLPLLLAGVMSKNPTAVQQESALEAMQDRATGIFTVTRHPVQWGILLWALSHVIANGDAASMLLFGTLVLVSGFGTLMIDLRKSRQPGEGWQTFYRTTSNMPFAAILSGRNKLSLTSRDWLAVGLGVLVYTVVYYFHAALFGVALF